jgi:ornithine cyclodeaminase
MVQFLDVPAVVRLVSRIGPVPFLAGLVDYLESDFRRWESFEKSARLASHSPVGVIELMPTSDETLYAFKYVNGHPDNAALGKLTVTGLTKPAWARAEMPSATTAAASQRQI